MWKSSSATLESEEPASPETLILRYKELPPIERIAGPIKALEKEGDTKERAVLFKDAIDTANEIQEMKGFRMLLKIANGSEKAQVRLRARETAIEIATPKERCLACLAAIHLVSKDLLIRTAHGNGRPGLCLN